MKNTTKDIQEAKKRNEQRKNYKKQRETEFQIKRKEKASKRKEEKRKKRDFHTTIKRKAKNIGIIKTPNQGIDPTITFVL